MPFQLEAVQANDGDCLLLHYDSKDKPGLILIDGGSRGVYKKYLKQRLEQLRAKARQLELRLVMVSHIDADHITGLVDLFKEQSELFDNGAPLPYKIRSVWHNSFEKLAGKHTAAVKESSVVGASLAGVVPAGLSEKTAAVVASVAQGNDLRRYASKTVTINAETNSELLKAPRSGVKAMQLDDNLKFTILGPREAELQALEDSWKTSKQSNQANEESAAADYLNRTVPNLSSIVVLAESKDGGRARRMLLTGDAGGDMILESLKSAKLLDAKGAIHVDLLKVQHHGSNHSVDIDFFRKVKADVYVISGNGKHGIPHNDTMHWLSQARTGETIDVYLTNRQGDDGLTEMFDKFLAEEKAKEPKHRYHFRTDPALSIMVEWPAGK
jgi:beta-lactamase superfamily II metal-dependent hydrolase